VHHGDVFAATMEGHHCAAAEDHLAIHTCMDCPIFANVRVIASTVPRSLLANEHFARPYHLATETLHAAALRSAISAVGGCPTSLFMSHSRGIVGVFLAGARDYEESKESKETKDSKEPFSERQKGECSFLWYRWFLWFHWHPSSRQ
jgi:hypothetical protein